MRNRASVGPRDHAIALGKPEYKDGAQLHSLCSVSVTTNNPCGGLISTDWQMPNSSVYSIIRDINNIKAEVEVSHYQKSALARQNASLCSQSH